MHDPNNEKPTECQCMWGFHMGTHRRLSTADDCPEHGTDSPYNDRLCQSVSDLSAKPCEWDNAEEGDHCDRCKIVPERLWFVDTATDRYLCDDCLIGAARNIEV